MAHLDDINMGLYPRPWLCPLGLTTSYMDCSGVRVFTAELLWTVFHLLLPPPTPPTHPSATLAQNWCAPLKNEVRNGLKSSS